MIETQSNTSFAITFVSFTMILLAFFIFLNSLAQPNALRKEKALISLEKHFVPPRSGLTKGPKQEIPSALRPPQLIEHFPKMSLSERYSKILSHAEKGGFAVKREAERFVISIPGPLLFSTGDDQIRAENLALLKKIAEEAAQLKVPLEIQSHTKEAPFSSKRFSSNWELSLARAVSMYRFFLDSEIPADKLSAAGYAGFHPMEEHAEADGMPSSERIVLILGRNRLPST